MTGPIYHRIRDGQLVTKDEATENSGIIRDGYRVTGIMFMDSRVAVADAAFLFDAAGKPLRLIDKDTGAPASIALNEDVINAMKAEAGKLNLSLERYVKEVLRFASAHESLTKKEGQS